MILFDVVLDCLPGTGEALCDLLRATMAACRDEPGCTVYRFTRDLDAASRFYLTELWDDEDSLQAHARGAGFRAFLAGLPAVGRIVGSNARQGLLTPYVFTRTPTPQA